MAEETTPKPSDAPDAATPPPTAGAAPEAGAAASGDKPADSQPPAPTAKTVEAEPLADGTVPTVLTPGSSHKQVAKGRVSIGSIYRRADIVSTALTFAGALLAAGAIFGIYAYLTRNTHTATKAPTVSNLNKTDLSALQDFFEGNSAGSSSEVVSINSSSLFKQRVAISSDLKVTGGIAVTGTTALGELTVDKVATLGVTNVRGALTVAGPINLQSPALLGAGASVSGNLAVTGNGSFGGSLSAGTLNIRDLSVAGTLNLAGHLAITGQNPTAAPSSETGTGGNVTIDGNDSGGTVTINTGNVPFNPANVGGLLATITYKVAYGHTPRVIISPIGENGAALQYYAIKTANNFIIGTGTNAASNTTYVFDYWVVQ